MDLSTRVFPPSLSLSLSRSLTSSLLTFSDSLSTRGATTSYHHSRRRRLLGIAVKQIVEAAGRAEREQDHQHAAHQADEDEGDGQQVHGPAPASAAMSGCDVSDSDVADWPGWSDAPLRQSGGTVRARAGIDR